MKTTASDEQKEITQMIEDVRMYIDNYPLNLKYQARSNQLIQDLKTAIQPHYTLSLKSEKIYQMNKIIKESK